MRMQYKFMKIANDTEEINRSLEIASAWGWQVICLQVIDSKTYQPGNTFGMATQAGVYTFTETIVEHTSYAPVTLGRDMEDTRFDRWVDLEEEYEKHLAYIVGKKKRIRERIKDVIYRQCTIQLIAAGVFCAAMLVTGMTGAQSVNLFWMASLFSAGSLGLLAKTLIDRLRVERKIEKRMQLDEEYVSLIEEMNRSILPQMDKLIDQGLNL